MNYYLCLMLLTIFKNLNYITCINIFVTKSNDENRINFDLSNTQQKELNTFESVSNIEQSLTHIFPFLRFIEGLCVQFYIEPYDTCNSDIDLLNLGECKMIKSFQLKSNNIRDVPEYIKSFNHIKDLNFSSNKLTSSCFDRISELFTLKSLNLEYNSVRTIPHSILKLINLKELRIGACNIHIAPEFVSNFKLEVLDLSHLNPVYNKQDNIKEKTDIVLKIINGFLEIKTLESVKLSFNKLSNINFHGKDYNIKKLDLSNNKLSKITDTILKFKKLEYLDLGSNKFKEVPSVLVKIESLKELNLKTNPIKSYDKICFHSLETLHIVFGAEYCDEKFYIKNLSSPIKHLHVTTGPYFYKLKSEIYRMVDLKSLWIYGPVRISKNDKISELKNLEFLNLNYFLVDSCVDPIFKLKKLKTLCLNLHPYGVQGFSKEFFSGLKKLKNLQYLSLNDLGNGCNSILDNKIFDLENLKELQLEGFYIKNVEGFARLSNLKYLEIKNIKFYDCKEKVRRYLKRINTKIKWNLCKYCSDSL